MTATATPETTPIVQFTARLREDLHARLRDKADQLDWSLNSALNAAVAEYLDRGAERDSATWMRQGWDIMDESGCCGHGYQITTRLSLPSMTDCDQMAYRLQDHLVDTVAAFGGRDVSTSIIALGGMERRLNKE